MPEGRVRTGRSACLDGLVVAVIELAHMKHDVGLSLRCLPAIDTPCGNYFASAAAAAAADDDDDDDDDDVPLSACQSPEHDHVHF